MYSNLNPSQSTVYRIVGDNKSTTTPKKEEKSDTQVTTENPLQNANTGTSHIKIVQASYKQPQNIKNEAAQANNLVLSDAEDQIDTAGQDGNYDIVETLMRKHEAVVKQVMQ